jgi:hypothetical protein
MALPTFAGVEKPAILTTIPTTRPTDLPENPPQRSGRMVGQINRPNESTFVEKSVIKYSLDEQLKSDGQV